MNRRPVSVLLVHGLASNARLWDGVANYLLDHGHGSLQVDLRGHGQSDKPSDGFDFSTMSADLAGLISEEMRKPVVVAGQSMGANLAMELADRHPELIRGVVCLDGGFVDLQSQFETWEKTLDLLTPPPMNHLDAVSLAEGAKSNYRDWPPGAAEAQMANLELLSDGTVRRRLPLESHLAILRAMFDQRPLELAARAPRPVLVIAADDGMPGKTGFVADFSGRLPQGNLVTIEGHHDLHAQHPDLVGAAMLEVIEAGP